MISAVKHCLRNLFTFSGRDARSTFWWMVLAVYLMTIVISSALTIPFIVNMTVTTIHQAGQGASPQAVDAAVRGQVGAMMGSMTWVSMAIGILSMLLIAATLVRRLHDAGLTGWIALIPAAAKLTALARVPANMDKAIAAATGGGSMHSSLGQMSYPGFGMSVVLGWAPLLFLTVLGLLSSTPGTNKYGDIPPAL